MASKEWVKVWQQPVLHGLEMHHATYITHAFSRHMHDYFVIGLIESGNQTFWYRGARHSTPPGGVFVINPGEVHTGEAADKYGFTYRTFYPDVSLLQRVSSEISRHDQHMPVFPAAVIQDQHLTRLLTDMHAALATPISSLECEARFFHAFAYLLSHYAEYRPPEQEPGNERQAIRCVRDYIDEHYMHKVTLTELARLVNLSPYYLLRAFEKDIGVPPHIYLESVRIRRAQQLLTGGVPPARIAYELGFSDQSHFNNRFKRLLGVTPGHYLRQGNIVQEESLPFQL